MNRSQRRAVASDMRTRGDRTPWNKSPQPGDIIVACGHTRKAPICLEAPIAGNEDLWLELLDESGQPAVTITHPKTGALIRSRWLATCKVCLLAAGSDPLRVEIRQHFEYSPS